MSTAVGGYTGTYLWVPGHGIDALSRVRVRPPAGRGVDVPHHPITRRHHRTQRLGELLLLLPVLSAAVLEPDLENTGGNGQ